MNTPHLWIPKAKIIEPKRAIDTATRLQGFFKLEAVRPDGRRRLLADWFPNLITDAGLDIIGTSGAWLSYCRVGTGNTTPNVADTALAGHLAATNNSIINSGTAQSIEPYYGARTKTFRFAEGAAAGNLQEVGIGTAATGSTLFSRALILDSGGSPTTVTVLSDESLDVTYQLRLYPPLSDVVDTINISGTDYDFTKRAALVTTASAWYCGISGDFGGGFPGGVVVYSGTMGAITGSPSGTTSNGSTTNASYGATNLYRDFSTVWGLTAANFGGIQSALATMGPASSAFGAVQVEFDPVIPKTSSQILTLVFRHSWARGVVP